MKRPDTAGTSNIGLHHVAKIVSEANSIFHPIGQENDVGNDGIIEFILNNETTGCCIGVQIKSGKSYIKNDVFSFTVDDDHLKYWQSHTLPIAGIVYDPERDLARWLDITAHILNSSKPTKTLVANHPFDMGSFSDFKNHFLEYRKSFSDEAHFGRTLKNFSHINNIPECFSALKSLFSFHRDKTETWYYLASSIRNFRGNPILRNLIITLCHIPGHMDIFWSEKNIILESTQDEVCKMFNHILTRDDLIVLISAIDDESGLMRGSIGQCVNSIVGLCPGICLMLESIALDNALENRLRFWAAVILTYRIQLNDISAGVVSLRKLLSSFSGEEHEKIAALINDLESGYHMDFG